MPSSENLWQISRLVRKNTETGNVSVGKVQKQYYVFSPFMKAEERFSLPGYILKLNRTVYSEGFSISSNTDDSVELFYVYGGSCTLSCGKDNKVNCKKSSVIFIRSERDYVLTQSQDASLDLLRIKCAGTLALKLGELICENDFTTIALSREASSNFIRIAESFIPLLSAPSKVGNVKISNLISYLMTELYTVKNLNSDREEYTEEYSNRLLAIIEYIDENLNKKLTVTELASRCQMSESLFFRRFGEFVGTSPYDYLIERRLERAATLLRTSGFQIKTVSRLVGFPSSNHFSMRFRKKYGVLPHEYRK